MHNITLQVSNKSYPHLQYIINNLPDVKIIEDLEIETIQKDEKDYKEIKKIKAEKNKKYSFDETMRILDI